MNREDVRKLLGGYATGTLTPAEQKALFEAALEDQELFDSLADEQALKEVFEDPACRARVAAALEKNERGFWAWLRRPAAWTVAGSLAGTVLLAVVLTRSAQVPLSRREMAMRTPPVEAPAPPADAIREEPPPAAAPAPRPVPPKRAAQASSDQPAEERPRMAAAKIQEPPRRGGFVGGTPGGVIGGIIGPPSSAPALPAPPVMAADRMPQAAAAAPVAAAAPPPPPAAAQTNKVETARSDTAQRFAAEAAPLRSTAFVTRAPLAFRIQKRTESGGYADSVASDLHAGDSLRLAVTSQTEGYLYVLWRADSGDWRLLFPSEGEPNRLEPRREVVLPTSGEWRADAAPGQKRVLLVLAAEPEPAFRTTPLEPLVARLRREAAGASPSAARGFGMVRPSAAVPGAAGQAAHVPPLVTELTLRLR